MQDVDSQQDDPEDMSGRAGLQGLHCMTAMFQGGILVWMPRGSNVAPFWL